MGKRINKAQIKERSKRIQNRQAYNDALYELNNNTIVDGKNINEWKQQYKNYFPYQDGLGYSYFVIKTKLQEYKECGKKICNILNAYYNSAEVKNLRVKYNLNTGQADCNTSYYKWDPLSKVW